ncbi:hypothetical protein B0H14DRAFT_2389913, partial [Mycena olivaceomarginata]
ETMYKGVYGTTNDVDKKMKQKEDDLQESRKKRELYEKVQTVEKSQLPCNLPFEIAYPGKIHSLFDNSCNNVLVISRLFEVSFGVTHHSTQRRENAAMQSVVRKSKVV